MSTHLDSLQHWMQAVITHPDGVVVGAEHGAARERMDVAIEDVVQKSDSLSALSRLAIYSSMYFERLIGVMAEDFAAVRDLVGEAAFRGLMRDYLVSTPSTHYSLNMLGARFPGFLAAHAGEESLPPLVAELAQLERTVQEVFDAEPATPVGTDELEAVPAEAWTEARLVTVPALRLMAFGQRTNVWYQAFRDDEPRPEALDAPSWVAVYRRGHRVWRLELDPVPFTLLEALQRGERLGAALESAASHPDANPAELGAAIGTWFRDWTGLGFFRAIELG